jgi:LmbE family N-acetylglucosaminyl deacetylase
LSPHFDDAVGSCGGLIARLVASEIDVGVLTVFGGEERMPLSPAASACHEEWKRQDVTRARRTEDEAACAFLGAYADHCDFAEALYRQRSDASHPYPALTDLQGPVAAEDATLPERIADRVTKIISGEAVIIHCPMAIGQHVDHVLVRTAGLVLSQRGSRVWLYRDFHYRECESAPMMSAVLSRPMEFRLTDDEVKKKGDAFAYYDSQITCLFGDDANMRQYFAVLGRTEMIACVLKVTRR